MLTTSQARIRTATSCSILHGVTGVLACLSKHTDEPELGIVQVVESSADVNHAQLVATQDGKVIVPTYDWASFFDEPFRQSFEGHQIDASPYVHTLQTRVRDRQG